MCLCLWVLAVAGYSSQWCTDHFVHSKAMQKAREVRQQLVDTMKIQKMAFSEAGDRSVTPVFGAHVFRP